VDLGFCSVIGSVVKESRPMRGRVDIVRLFLGFVEAVNGRAIILKPPFPRACEYFLSSW
jgi:hypothetical protein